MNTERIGQPGAFFCKYLLHNLYFIFYLHLKIAHSVDEPRILLYNNCNLGKNGFLKNVRLTERNLVEVQC